jgi:predicted MPP superfamily phosphohydrolase
LNPLTYLTKILKRIVLSVTILILSLVLLFFYARQVEPNLLLVCKSQVSITNLPKELTGIRIVQISDLHGKLFPANKLIDKVNALKPDILVITGDVLDPFHRDYSYIHQVLGPMQAKYGKYYVSGNNEYDAKLSWDEMEKAYRQAKVTILHNRSTRINYKGSYLWLVGVDDPNTERDRLDQAMRGTDRAPKILLAHSPEIINKASGANIDLVLVGHTLGGQVRIPGLTQRPGVKVRLDRVLAKANYWVNRGLNYLWRRGEQMNDSYFQELQFP